MKQLGKTPVQTLAKRVRFSAQADIAYVGIWAQCCQTFRSFMTSQKFRNLCETWFSRAPHKTHLSRCTPTVLHFCTLHIKPSNVAKSAFQKMGGAWSKWWRYVSEPEQHVREENGKNRDRENETSRHRRTGFLGPGKLFTLSGSQFSNL